MIPEWTQPTLSAEQIRANGGVPPPPEPILPTEFAIQLYNPDHQVNVRYKPATFTSAATWELEMPQQTFREPSSSKLDRSQNDPVASDLTPKLGLKWKKDGKFNKDMACYVSGKSKNPDGSKRKYKEPDVTVAIFKGLKEVTLYESNLARVEIEDIKGLEVVLLLGAVVIRDVYFGSVKETFHISGGSSGPGATSPILTTSTPSQTAGNYSPRQSFSHGDGMRDNRVPPTDPRTQWELDVETARLKRIAEEEERTQKRKDEVEQRKIKKMLEAEEKEQKRRQAELDKETDRLRKLYGREDASARPQLPARPAPQRLAPPPQQHPNAWGGHFAQSPAPSPYMSGAVSAPNSGLLSPATPNSQRLKQKSSFFGFRRGSDQGSSGRLHKKTSSVF